MLAVILAGASAALGVAGGWWCVAAVDVQRLLLALAGTLAPARAATQGDREPTLDERRRLAVLSAGCLGVAGWILGGVLAGTVIGAGGPAGAALLVRARRARWRLSLHRGAPPALRAVADALSSGHTLPGALVVAERDGAVDPPVRALLADVSTRIDLGASVEDALEYLRAQAGSGAWDRAVAAILVQRACGGDVVTLLRGLATNVDAAARGVAEARTASAQARLTARIVLGLPLLAAGALVAAAPSVIAAIAGNPLALVLLALAAILQGLALIAVRTVVGGSRV